MAIPRSVDVDLRDDSFDFELPQNATGQRLPNSSAVHLFV